MVTVSRLKQWTKRLPNACILVIGDIILDEFIWGDVNRISPEAPVPVVWVKSESFMPGGASNVANNLNALGSQVFLCGVIGSDYRGELLRQELQKRGMDISGLIVDGTRPTTLKTRVVAHHQQVVRVDREKITEITGSALREVLEYVHRRVKESDAILIEDYGKGVITSVLLKEIVALAKSSRKLITVDPKESHFNYYRGVTVITPNQFEAANAVGSKIIGNGNLHQVGKLLLKRLRCHSVLITLGENGMCLFESSGRVTHIPTVAQEVFDVSGAGDTVIAVLTSALSVGATMEESAYLANFAAGIVVGKVGVAVVTRQELLDRIQKDWPRLKAMTQ